MSESLDSRVSCARWPSCIHMDKFCAFLIKMTKCGNCFACFMCLGSLALFGVGIMYYVVKFKDDRYSSSLVTIDNVTVPSRYCGICDINYCCALSKTANLTADSTVRMWYIRSNKHVDIVARLNQPYKYYHGKGSGCICGSVAIIGIIVIFTECKRSNDVDREPDVPKIPKPSSNAYVTNL